MLSAERTLLLFDLEERLNAAGITMVRMDMTMDTNNSHHKTAGNTLHVGSNGLAL